MYVCTGADAGGDDNDEGGEEANPFEEFMPGGFVGRAASEDADKPEAVAIVGGGPAALSAAVYCARAGLRPVVVAPPVGGQLMGKGVDVENYPGLLDMTGPGIVHQMRRQALSFNTAFDGQYITSVDFATKPFKLTTNTSKVLRTHAVILATGADSNWLDVPGEYDFRGKGISSCATCDGFLFRDKPVVVIGGGDTAMEDALVLARTSSSVTVIHRRWNATVKEFTANTKEKMEDGSHPVGHVIVTDTSTGEESSIDCDAAFVAIGHSPNTGFVEGQVEMDENKYLTVKPGTSHTSVEGVFAAGDVHDHVYRQAITSAGSGAMAALDAERWLSETGFVIEDEPAAEVPAATAVENETAKAKAKEGVDGLNLDAAAAAAADAAGANFDKDL
jgi:thioredoxin reductase (NADPH)